MAIDLISWTKQTGDPLHHNEVNEQNNKINELIEWVNNYEQRHHGAGGSIANAVVVGVSQTYTFTGEPIIPEFRVYVGGTLLVKGEDYDSQIDNNTEIGTASITIYGIGDYTESKVVTFAIEGAKYNVTYVTEHGIAPATKRVSVLTAEDVPTLTDENYAFLGWFDENNREYTIGTILTSDVILIARWEAKTFSLTYDVNGHGTTPTQPTGKLSAIPTELPPMSADGYYFVGWFNDNTQVQGGETLTENTTLTAKWVANEVEATINVNDNDTRTLMLAPTEQTENVTVEYSTDGGINWSAYTEALSLTATSNFLTRVKYGNEVISTTPSITMTFDDDESTLVFTSQNGTVVDVSTSEAVGAIDFTTFTGEKDVTDGVQTAHLNVTSTSNNL